MHRHKKRHTMFTKNPLTSMVVNNSYVPSEAKQTLPLKTVPLQKALAVAHAAYRINEYTYIKNTQRFSEEENKTKFANKELVKFFFEENKTYLPTDFTGFSPTEEDYAAVAETQKWLKRYIMLGLGDLDDFKKDMLACVADDTVPVNALGRVAFIPEFVKRDQHETGLKKEIRIEYRNSQYLGNSGDKVEGVVKILDKRYSSMWESYNYTAVMDGNLVSFMNKFDHAIGAMKQIKGKVKEKQVNTLFSANETRLNYVKLYKV